MSGGPGARPTSRAWSAPPSARALPRHQNHVARGLGRLSARAQTPRAISHYVLDEGGARLSVQRRFGESVGNWQRGAGFKHIVITRRRLRRGGIGQYELAQSI